jgi:aarF domain-containing kinase
VTAAAALGLAAAVEPEVRDVAVVAAMGVDRVTRVAVTGVQLAAEYKWLGRRSRAADPDAYDQRQREVHARCADRLLKLFMANGGIYIKAGQYLASLGNSIPREYVAALVVLQDRAPHQPFSEVRRLFRQETGREPEAFFQSIEEEPIASASLAQVHRAYALDGQKVAVKVRRPHGHSTPASWCDHRAGCGRCSTQT